MLSSMSPQGIERGGKPSTDYGHDWRYCFDLAYNAVETARKLEPISENLNVPIVVAVCNLLAAGIERDRTARFQRELDTLANNVQKNKWDEAQVNEQLELMRLAYHLDHKGLETQLLERQKSIYFMGGSHPDIIFDPAERERRIYGRFVHLSLVNLPEKPEGYVLTLRPVHDGGINSLAYPVRELKVTITRDAPLKVDLFISHWRNNNLDPELERHPEVMEFIRGEVVRILELYVANPDLFWKREIDGNTSDPTQIVGPLYKFLDQYFRKRLPEKSYYGFRQSLEYIDSPAISAALGLRVLIEHLLPEDAYLQKGWYKKNHPDILDLITQRTKDELRELFGMLKESERTDENAIARRALTDRAFANKALLAWNRIFKVPKSQKIPADMIRNDLNQWVGIYRFDLETGTYQKCLEQIHAKQLSSGTVID